MIAFSTSSAECTPPVMAMSPFRWPKRIAAQCSRGNNSDGVEKCSEGRTSSVSMSKSG